MKRFSVLTAVLAMTLFSTAFGQDVPVEPPAVSPSQPGAEASQGVYDGFGTELTPDTFELYYNGKNL